MFGKLTSFGKNEQSFLGKEGRVKNCRQNELSKPLVIVSQIHHHVENIKENLTGKNKKK